VCPIFPITAKISYEIFGRNKSWILVFFCLHFSHKFCQNFVWITMKCEVEKSIFLPGLFRPLYYKNYGLEHSDHDLKNTRIDPRGNFLKRVFGPTEKWIPSDTSVGTKFPPSPFLETVLASFSTSSPRGASNLGRTTQFGPLVQTGHKGPIV
jgi:hypothetical protein